jgi:ribonuclease HI
VIEVYTDGLCMPVNPGGTATFGFEIRQNGRRIYEDCGVVGEGPEMSNNVAEYQAVQRAATWLAAKGLGWEEAVFKSDSKLVVNQMNGEWRVDKGLYVNYHQRALEAVRKLGRTRFIWIPREQNEYADALTERAYRDYKRSKH